MSHKFCIGLIAALPTGFKQTKPFVSLCAIVKNEAENLARCLNSAKGFVDEIWITDTGSTDGSLAIAQKFGAKVQQFSWCDDFAAARNYSLKNAQGSWILVLDADEELLPQSRSILIPKMRQQTSLVINLTRLEVGAVQAPYSIVSRLFRNHPQIQFKGIYHESIDESVIDLCHQESHWKISTIEPPLIKHFGYQPQEIIRKNKTAFARSLMEKHLAQYPEDAYMYSKLGALYCSSGESEAGIGLLKKGLTLATNPTTLFELHYHLASALIDQNNLIAAEQHYIQSLRQPVGKMIKLAAYFNLGSLYLNTHRAEEAIVNFTAVIALDSTSALAFYNLGIAHKSLGNLKDAIQSYRQAICYAPHLADAHRNLGVVYFKSGQIKAARDAFLQALQCYEQQHNTLAYDTLQQGLLELKIL